MISGSDLAWISDTVGEIYTSRTPSDLNACVLGRLHARFHGAVTLAESLSPDFFQYSCEHAIASITMMKGYEPYILDNPIFTRLHAGDPAPVMMASEAGSGLNRTEFFNIICRPHDIRDQLTVVARLKGRIWTFGVIGPAVFDRNDRALLELLQPHLLAGVTRVEPSDMAIAGSVELGWIELSEMMQPFSLGAGQQSILRCYFRNWVGAPALPEEILRWVASSRKRQRTILGSDPLRVLITESHRGTLYCRFFPNGSDPGCKVRLFERPTRPNYYELGKRNGLTSRESEILHYTAMGKRDAEIAKILGIAPKTVSKHLEHVYSTLKVRSRIEAALAVL